MTSALIGRDFSRAIYIDIRDLAERLALTGRGFVGLFIYHDMHMLKSEVTQCNIYAVKSNI